MSMKAELDTVTEERFEREVLHSSRAVLVEFTAGWCPPCRQIAPILRELAVQEAHRLRVLQVDVDQEPGLVARYRVLSMPTLLLLAGGVERLRLVGARPKGRLRAELAEVLG